MYFNSLRIVFDQALWQYVHLCLYCRYTKQNFVVRLGEYDFTTNNETKYIDYRVTDIKLHPDYDPATHGNDIALVRLNRYTLYNSFIRPICLPKTNMEVYKKAAVVTGEKNYLLYIVLSICTNWIWNVRTFLLFLEL